MAQPPNLTNVSLERLTALSDEIAALVRAGVPLERGLSQLSRDLPGRLGRITHLLVERMEQGESLAEALRASPEKFPPVYPALVEAGIRSGRLGAALEDMGRTGRRMLEMRRLIILAFMYPLFVLLLAYGMFVFFAMNVAPKFIQYVGVEQSPLKWITWLDPAWLAAFPIILVVIVLAWLHQTGRAGLLHSGGAGWALGWLPPVRRMLAASRAATFSEILSLLVEHQVPAPQAVRLAAEVSGDRLLKKASEQLALSIEQGQTPVSSDIPGFPPLLGWMICNSGNQTTLVGSLRHAAGHYRHRALRQSDWLRIYLPTLTTLFIGGTATVTYLMIILVPWLKIMNQAIGFDY